MTINPVAGLKLSSVIVAIADYIDRMTINPVAGLKHDWWGCAGDQSIDRMTINPVAGLKLSIPPSTPVPLPIEWLSTQLRDWNMTGEDARAIKALIEWLSTQLRDWNIDYGAFDSVYPAVANLPATAFLLAYDQRGEFERGKESQPTLVVGWIFPSQMFQVESWLQAYTLDSLILFWYNISHGKRTMDD